MNADGLIDNRGLNTQNLYAYCANNPVNFYDYLGTMCVCLYYRVRGDKHVCNDPEKEYIVDTYKYKHKVFEPLVKNNDFVELVATICGEAMGCNQFEIQACTQVVLNRVGNPSWKGYGNTSVSDAVKANSQFGGYRSALYFEMKDYISKGMPSDFKSEFGKVSDYNKVYNNVALVYTNKATNYIGNATMFWIGGKPSHAGKQAFIPFSSKHSFYIHKNDIN